MGAEPQKVNKIEIHYSNTAEEMVVKMLEWSIWSLLTVLQGRRYRGKPQWNLERRGPGRGDCWEDAQRDHKGPAEEPASGLSLSSTSSQWKEPNIGRGRGSFWCSCGARELSSLGRSQQQGAHHFFSEEGISTPGLHSGCHNAVACSKAVANYQSAHLPVSLPFSPGNHTLMLCPWFKFSSLWWPPRRKKGIRRLFLIMKTYIHSLCPCIVLVSWINLYCPHLVLLK